jgi:DNA polymerase III subunit gamma/tau
LRYQVIARRWRPQTFQEVVGQSHVVGVLMKAIQRERVAHAYLFSGPRGVGKTSVARILAKALNCVEGPTPYPCCRCGSCLEIAQGSFIDVLEMDAASNRGIDEVRGLRENVKYAPALGRYKVYIIDEVHMLTEAAFNALLKTLEEPPSHVVFIMATTEVKKIPPTILSRCQHFHFRPLAFGEVCSLLKRIGEQEGLNLEEGALELLSRASGGSLRDGEMLLEQVLVSAQGSVTRGEVAHLLGRVEAGVVEEAFDALGRGEPQRIMALFQEQVVDRGFDPYGFVEELVEKARQATIEVVKGGREPYNPQKILDLLLKLLERLRRHPLPDVLAEMELVRIASLPKLIPLAELIEELGAVERGEGVFRVSQEVSRKDVSASVGYREGELAKALKDQLGKARPLLVPILERCKIFKEGKDLILEFKRLNAFERERLEEGETVELIRGFLEERGLRVAIKLRDNGEEILKPPDRVKDPDEEILDDPRIQRALGLFRGKIVQTKPMEEDKSESGNHHEAGSKASGSHSGDEGGTG